MIIVAKAIPFTPKGGTPNPPFTNQKSSIVFRRKPPIKKFLKTTVFPIELSIAFEKNTPTKNIEPKMIISMYDNASLKYLPFAPNICIRNGEAKNPDIVKIMAKEIDSINECHMICFAYFVSFSPRALPIKAVTPWLMPPAIAIIIKKIEKVRDKAASDCVEILPAKNVSVTLNIV